LSKNKDFGNPQYQKIFTGVNEEVCITVSVYAEWEAKPSIWAERSVARYASVIHSEYQRGRGSDSDRRVV